MYPFAPARERTVQATTTAAGEISSPQASTQQELPESPSSPVASETERYLGPVIPEDAVMPTPPSTHAQPLSTPARPLCVIRMLQRDPPFLDLNVPVIRMDNSGPMHRPRRQKRQLYDVRKPASTLPVHANAARLQQQPKNPVSDSANEGSRAISSLIAAAQQITDSDIGDEDERTRDDIKKKRKVDSLDWRAREASFEEFAERADGVMGRFFAWAKEPEPELKHLPKPSQRPSAPPQRHINICKKVIHAGTQCLL